MNRKRRDYTPIRAEYISGTMSLADLASRHDVSVRSLEYRCAKEGWAAAREKFAQEVTARAEELVLQRNAQELAKFNDDDLRVAKSLRAKAARMLGGELTPVELRAVAASFDVAQRIGRLALGASTDNQTVYGRDGGPIQQEAAVVTPQELAEACRSVINKY